MGLIKIDVCRSGVPKKDCKGCCDGYKLNSGIQYLHENNYVHFDIKPQNIILVDGVGKLCDFGTCQKIDKDDVFEYYNGTIQFQSPESLLSQTFAGKPCDVWAFGITLYAYFFRVLPFFEDNLYNGINKIMNDQI